MSFAFNIDNCVAWAAGLTTSEQWQQFAQTGLCPEAELELPPLKNIPAMKRRRLSPFAKLALHCGMEAAGEYQEYIDTVFSSRHGDLHRTAALIQNVADKEQMSPTQFGLSVHNAAAGLFSIYTGNKAPISAIAAGESSFMAGLVDSLAKMKANQLDRILYVYTDLIVPDIYLPYVSDKEQSVSIALLLTPEPSAFSLELSAEEAGLNQELIEPLSFMQFYCQNQGQWHTRLNGQSWTLTRN